MSNSTASVAVRPATTQSTAAPAAPSASARPGDAVYDLGVATGLAQFNGIKIKGYDRSWTHPKMRSPEKLATFVWRADQVFTLLLFWFAGSSSRALKLIGHTGAGKSELVLQWHALFNLPLIYLSCNPKTEAAQLTGMMVPTPGAVVPMPGSQPAGAGSAPAQAVAGGGAVVPFPGGAAQPAASANAPGTGVAPATMALPGGMKFVDGPLITAARHGISVCLDEYNLIDPGEASGLNAFLEGKPYTVPETGEVIVPKPGFRIFGTMNPKSAGYRGRQKQDMANDDRFCDLFVSYMEPALETPLVKTLIERIAVAARTNPDPQALQKQAEQFVSVANAIRAKYMGDSDGPDALPCTMSTRTLLRWVEWTQLITGLKARGAFPGNKSAAHAALRTVLSSRQESAVQLALHALLTTTLNEKEEV
jgi:cobaltochelatase CobS